MRNQLLSTYDIASQLVLAPPKKQHMDRKVMGDVERLFAFPSIGNTHPNKHLLMSYQRKLKTSSEKSTYIFRVQTPKAIIECKIKMLCIYIHLQLHLI